MTPLPVIPHAYRCAFGWRDTLNGQTATNVMHFSATSATALDLRNALDANATQAMWSHTYDHAAIFQLEITKLDGSTPTVVFTDLTEDGRWTGTGSTDPIPAVCALVKLNTALRGRRHRGRVYLPWVKEGSQNGGALNETDRTNMQAAWVAWHTAMTAANWDFDVASYASPPAINVVTSLVVEHQTATQRRRQSRNR